MESKNDTAQTSRITARDIITGPGGIALTGDFRNAGITLHEGCHSEVNTLVNCRNELFLTDPEIDRATLIDTKGERVTGTCEWIKKDKRYASWLDGKDSLLWISGGPGKGKTMLSIFLTQELEQEVQTVYFFCASDDKDRNNAIAVLRALIWQILERCPQLADHLLGHLDNPNRSRYILGSPEALWVIFMKVVQDNRLGKTYCVLDGLDELVDQSRMWLIKKLVSMARSAGTVSLKLVIVSRYIQRLNNLARVDLDSEKQGSIDQDIQLVINDRVEELAELHSFSRNFRQMVERTLTRQTENTFLWVGFAMIELMEKGTQTEIENCLRTLPKGLPGFYSRMLLQINSEYVSISRSILHWVTMAVSPLSLLELATAIKIQTSEDLELEQAIYDRVKICGPILELRKGRVNLVHHSARDYLVSCNPDLDTIAGTFQIIPEDVHLEIATRCLACIEENMSKGDSPLLHYAIFNWAQHARLASTPTVLMTENSGFFAKDSVPRQEWQRVYEDKGWRIDKGHSDLHIACHLGIDVWVQQILSASDVSTDGKDIYGDTPLAHAAFGGHEAVVKRLLDTGKVNALASNRSDDTPLDIASEKRHETVIKLLEDATGTKAKVGSSNIYEQQIMTPVACRGAHLGLLGLDTLFTIGQRHSSGDDDSIYTGTSDEEP